MAILFADGFDHYATAAQLAVMYPSMTQTNWTLPNTGQPFGRGRIARHAVGVASSGLPRDVPTVPMGQPFGFSCHIMVEAYATGVERMVIAQFLEGNTEHVSVRVSSDGSLYCTRNGTYLHPVSNKVLALNQWYHIEARFVVHDTLGEWEVRVDGQTWVILNPTIAGGNVDTRNGNTGVINAVRMLPKLSATSNGTISMDNAVMWDEAGAQNNTWLGDVEVLTLTPESDGSVTGWTPNAGAAYAAIDDGSSGSDGDTTYIASATVDDVANFELTNLPVTPDLILAVQSYIVARKTDSGTRLLKHGVNSNGEVSESDDTPLSTTYAGFTFVTEINPDTGLAFTPSEVNSLRSHIKTSG